MKFKKIAALFAILAVMVSTTPVFADTQATSTSQRLQGQNRYETSAVVTETGWQNGSDYVIVASGEEFADALCSIPLAKKYNAPVLLTTHDNIPEAIKNEIGRLKAKHIIIIGGEGAVSKQAQDSLQASISAKSDIRRIWGKDRFETSVEIAQELGTTNKAFLAYGYNYADALSVSSIAAIEGMPILLTDKNSLPSSVERFIETNKPAKSYIIGLEGAVGKSVEEAINRITAHQAVRLGGNDRYETNVRILREFEGDIKFDNVFVATSNGPTGNEFADALSGAALAAQRGAPLILVYNTLPSVTESYLKDKLKESSVILVIGGKAVLSDDIVNKIAKHIDEKKNQNNPSPSNPTNTTGTTSGEGRGHGDSDHQDNSYPVVKTYGNSVTIIYSDSNIQNCAVTIDIYEKDTKNYKYINQVKLEDGKCQFNTSLDDGTYEGKMNVNGSIINLPEFTVR